MLQKIPNSNSKITSFSEFLRPRKISELTLPSNVANKIQSMIDSADVMSMIFYGSPGTGKTSCSKIIADSEKFDCISINASLEKGMKCVRETIAPFTTAMSFYQKQKIVFLDEVDAMLPEAQESLRCVIEQCNATCRFILTANKLSKIHPALQSRCMPVCFDIPLNQMSQVTSKVKSVISDRLHELNIDCDDSKVLEIVQLNYPDFRLIANKIEFELL